MTGGGQARLLVSALPGERRVALVAGDECTGASLEDIMEEKDLGASLRDLFIERADAPPQAGDLYRARVTRVERGLEAAFLALGPRDGQPAGFLPLDKMAGDKMAGDKTAGDKTARPLVEGEAVTVRVTRAGGGGKAAKVTAKLGPADMARLADPSAAGPAGPESGGPGLLSRGADAVTTLLRARPEDRPVEILVEGLAAYQAIARDPALAAGGQAAPAVTLYQGPESLFERAGLEAAIDSLLLPRVALPSGGGLTIEPVSSMVAVDVDSGGASGPGGGSGGAARLARQVNKEAAAALVRQVRLRALSGLIVVDFLEAGDRAARQAFVGALRRFFNRDPQPVQVLGMSASGLVEIQRRRARPALHEILTEPAGEDGSGRRKRPATLAFEALRALPAAARGHPGRPLALRAPAAVIAALQEGPAGAARADLEARLGFKLVLEVQAAEAAPDQGQFAILPV